MPMSRTCCIASRLGKRLDMVIRVLPPPMASMVTVASVTGSSGLGVPSWSAKPSRKARLFGGSTATISHQPCASSPVGPVM